MILRQLEAFRAVMLSGSVTQAAAMLHISQPAVSKLLADLEHQLGFPLFVRSKGLALVVTPEADLFLHEVERNFAGIAALKQAAAEIRNASAGTLRVAALPALGVSFLPAVIRTFRRRHPGVAVQLQTRSSSTVRQWIANRQFDIGLATPAREMPGVDMKPFLRCAGACVLPTDHPLTKKAVITPLDLEGEPFISLALEDRTRHRIDRVFDDAGVARELVIETQYAMTICALVLEGLGCSILNPITAQDYVERGLIVRPFEPEVPFEYMLFTPSLSPISRVTEAFIAVLEEHRTAFLTSGARAAAD